MNKIENCRITSTMLGDEDHGIPSGFIHLSGDAGWGQGYGGYDLRYKDYMKKFVFDMPRILGVSCWEKLPGTVLRVEHDNGPGSSRKILRIGHIINDCWFTMEGGE